MKRVAHALNGAILLAGILVLASCNRGGVSVNGYQFDRNGETANRHEEGAISAEIRSLKVDNHFGRVRIAVADGAPGWTWDLTCWADTEETAQEFTERIKLQIDGEGDGSSWTLILPPPPVPELRGVESNLTLAVPAATRVEVVNRFGDTEIQDVQGGTHARCQHGKLQLTGPGGEIDAETSFAELSAEGISGGRLVNRHGSISAVDVSGDLQAETEHGDLEVRGVSGELKVDNAHAEVTVEGVAGRAEITTSFADLRVENVEGEVVLRNAHGGIVGRRLRGNADVRTEFAQIDLEVNCPEVVCRNQHGQINLNLVGSGVRSVDAETSFSDLSVNVPGSSEPRIQAHTSYGKVDSDFPVYTMQTGIDNFQDLGSGELRITLRNEHGDIRVNKSAEGGRGE